MIGIITNNSLSNITLDQCTCQMIKSNQLISALNYFQTNQTCQLFTYNISTILIQYYSNSSLLFINQTSITITRIQSTTTEATTTSTISTSTTTTSTSAPTSSTTIAATTTAPPSTTCSTPTTSVIIQNNQFIYSPTSQRFAAGMGNNHFGVYNAYGYGNVTSSAIWTATQTSTPTGAYFAAQVDANLVVYASNAAVLWTSHTSINGANAAFCSKNARQWKSYLDKFYKHNYMAVKLGCLIRLIRINLQHKPSSRLDNVF